MNINLTHIYKKHKGQWVALDNTLSKVVCSSKSAKTTYNKAVEKGFKTPTLFKVPLRNVAYFGINLA